MTPGPYWKKELDRLAKMSRTDLEYDLKLSGTSILDDTSPHVFQPIHPSIEHMTLRWKYNKLVDLVLQLKDALDERKTSP